MKNFLVAQRYAKALSESVADDALEGLLEDAQALSNIVSDHEALRIFLNNPAIPLKERRDAFRDVVAAVTQKDILRNLADTLLARGRISVLTEVIACFGALVDRRLNRIAATIASAQPLSSEHEQQLRECLAAYSGKTVRTTTQIDPELLGGVVVEIGGKILDGSLRARLARLRETLTAEET